MVGTEDPTPPTNYTAEPVGSSITKIEVFLSSQFSRSAQHSDIAKNNVTRFLTAPIDPLISHECEQDNRTRQQCFSRRTSTLAS